MVTYGGGGTYYTTGSASTTSSTLDIDYGTGSTATSDILWYDEHGRVITGPRPRTLIREVVKSEGVIKKPTGHLEIYLKDGTHIVIDKDQNLRVRDDDAKVLYKSNRVREFNRFINASDLLEAFIHDMGELGATQGNILDTPINVFIHWLIYKAAQQDGDPVEKPRLYRQPQCQFCRKFIPKTLAASGFLFCNPSHAERHYAKLSHGG